MNINNIRKALSKSEETPEELVRDLKIELIDVVKKMSKKGYAYDALHTRYFDPRHPDYGWKDLYTHAKSKATKIIVDNGPYNKDEFYRVKALKNQEGYWEWIDIRPVSVIPHPLKNEGDDNELLG